MYVAKNRVALTGNQAVAYAMKQINPDVCAAYPITPSTDLMQEFCNYVANGEVTTEMVLVESEHSAMSACIGAAAAGGRVMTATSACGLALMWEVLYVASSCRLPIVMTLVNRAFNAPLNIHCDHSDAMGSRDAGWIQIFGETAQEAYDNTIQAVRIAEHPDVRLPVMSCFDGFIISHSLEVIELIEDEKVREFVGEYRPSYSLLDVDNPITVGPLDLQNYYMEHKRQQREAMEIAKGVILDVGKEFGKKFGREYGFYDEYMLDDADIAVVVLSSTAGTTRVAVDELRRMGIKAGLLKPRVFRPFPGREFANALSHVKAIAVLDRAETFGGEGGPLFIELRSSLYNLPRRPIIVNRIFGLGGRDIFVHDIKAVFCELLQGLERGVPPREFDYITIRE